MTKTIHLQVSITIESKKSLTDANINSIVNNMDLSAEIEQSDLEHYEANITNTEIKDFTIL
jgi:hypothetical protein